MAAADQGGMCPGWGHVDTHQGGTSDPLHRGHVHTIILLTNEETRSKPFPHDHSAKVSRRPLEPSPLILIPDPLGQSY